MKKRRGLTLDHNGDRLELEYYEGDEFINVTSKKYRKEINLKIYADNSKNLADYFTEVIKLNGRSEQKQKEVCENTLPIFDVRFSEARAKVCKQFDYWKICDSWTKNCRCLARCEYHLQT